MRLHPLFVGAVFAALLHPARGAQLSNYDIATQPWPLELGSHRVIVNVDADTPLVHARLEWRRRDRAPEKRGVRVQSLRDSSFIKEVTAGSLNPEAGDIVFRPATGPGEYAIYFLPARISGGAFPRSEYDKPNPAAAPGWQDLPLARPVRWEARTRHDAFTEMEVIATDAEQNALRESHPGLPFFVFIEDREHVVRMFNHLPQRWTAASRTSPELQARPDEYLVFQTAVWAARQPLRQMSLRFSDFKTPDGGTIAASAVECFHFGGTDWVGRKFTRDVSVAQDSIQPFWCGLMVPRDAKPGRYTGSVTVSAASGSAQVVPLTLVVSGDPLDDHGDSNPANLSGLRWLNSTIGSEDKPTAWYLPLSVEGLTIRCLGRTVELGPNGLPARIRTYFNESNTRITNAPLDLLAAPIELIVTTANGAARTLTARTPVTFTSRSPAHVEWTAVLAEGPLAVTVRGRMEFDGSLSLQLHAESSSPLDLADVRLAVPRTAATTRYVIGMGREAGANEPDWEWKWDPAKNQDSVWLGAVNGGLRLLLKDDQYRRPAVNIHYSKFPLRMPASWYNAGKGGVKFQTSGKDAALAAFSGPLRFEPGKPVRFDFDLLVTPFHPLRTEAQWAERYYHTSEVPRDFVPYLDKAKADGATVINIHQGNWLNPYINYPFLTARALRDFTTAANQRGLRVKFYYTVRELTDWAPEIFALRSLDDEILAHGPGGGHPWLEEHLNGDYLGAWYEQKAQDASMLLTPMSRWNNAYLEGLRWLVQNANCEGIYLDDIAYDRSTMLRARRVLDQYVTGGGLVDLHSWNEFHPGGAFAQCANLFMDSLPFVDRLWFGEGHHYDGPSADHFLLEISGIPYGLMGEMLEGGGNPWMGLVHGCTGRLGWQGNPRPIWKLFDDFGVRRCDFIGWWDSTCPVQTGSSDVKATVYQQPGKTLVALANFAKETRTVKLAVDWKKLGLDPAKATLYAPALPGLQREVVRGSGDAIRLAPFSGAAFIVDETPREITANASEAARPGKVLIEESFVQPLPRDWTTDKFNTSVFHTGEAGLHLTGPAHAHAWIERPLPDGAQGVSVLVWRSPEDAATSWGPGIALRWDGNRILKVNLREDRGFSIAVNGREQVLGSQITDKPVELTILWDDVNVRIIAGGPGMDGQREEVAAYPQSRFTGKPTAVRLGKMPTRDRVKDAPDPGATGVSRFETFRIHGAGTE